ncbi:hypothetical protein Q4574_01945 [Aliiglaciecola sp. 3_MG-2023]|uniref:hypothetical protein n=1 Tax=Aliiglaciecola sp. 3_MG-2023 TaxID=3062644 RepID=UPI0026E2ADA2|nr:hypothetical protein [Aliiglaciecola sp. 3_MG-2023]MDO6692022.1 hypothetical protein [Aliiglaciecola sp. 3_MG-2023]
MSACQLTCWKCGNRLDDVIFPMSRREECANCGADQHVCKMCKDYDVRSGCNEPRAEQVSDTEKANFCDYFSPSGNVFTATHDDKAQQAKAQLAALFGDEPAVDNVPKSAANNEDKALTPAQIAEQKLRDMLGE